MSTSDRRGMGRALSAAGALAAAVAIAWMFFGLASGSGFWKIFPQLDPSDDATSRLITEKWFQLYYDRTTPDTGLDGDVTIVAFLDYDSADCRKVAKALAKLRKADRAIRIVFKELVVPGSKSEFAVRAALASHRQDRFLLMHKELTQGPLQPSESSVIMAAGMAGLDIERLRADMNDPAVIKAIEENRALALALGITNSPALLVGKRIFHGVVDLAALEAAVAQARRHFPQ